MHFHIVSLSCFYFKTILFNIIIHLDFLLNINFLLPIKQKVMLALRERISQSFLMIQMGPLWTHSCPLLPSLSVALQWHTFVHTEIWHDFQICFLWNLRARNSGAGNAMSLSLFIFFREFTLPLAWHQSLSWHFNVVLYKFKIIVLSEKFCLCSFVYAVINPWNLLYFHYCYYLLLLLNLFI